jgi:hypothetical protein
VPVRGVAMFLGARCCPARLRNQSGMRRQPARLRLSDPQRLLDGVGDEDHGEAACRTKGGQQLVLASCRRVRGVERGRTVRPSAARPAPTPSPRAMDPYTACSCHRTAGEGKLSANELSSDLVRCNRSARSWATLPLGPARAARFGVRSERTDAQSSTATAGRTPWKDHQAIRAWLAHTRRALQVLMKAFQPA